MHKSFPNIYWPKISIVTPSYNQGKFIEQTILSVISQNYPNLEYIIIDGGSTDETVDIIKKYEQHITYWVSEKDNGQSHAINKGIEKCTGEIFNWLNSDDWYEPNALFIVASAFMSKKSIQFVSGYENHVLENGTVILDNGTYLRKTIEQTIEDCHIAQPSTFFKLDAIRLVGGVSNDLHYIMDGELWVKLLLLYGEHNFKKIDKAFVNFRIHAFSKTTSNNSVDNFLFERSSIIIDLQKFVNVPVYITEYYISDIYQPKKIINFQTNWQINRKIISTQKLKHYFIKKYITKQFIANNPLSAKNGLRILLKDKVIDLFVLKSIFKLCLNSAEFN